MHAAALSRTTRLWFALLVTAVLAIEGMVAQRLPTSPAPTLLAGAIMFDLLVALPAAYWWVFLRNRLPASRLVPFVAAAMAACWLILPPEQRRLVSGLRLLAIPAEVVVSAFVLRAAIRAARSGSEAGVVERIRTAAAHALPWPAAADVVASELSVLAYSILSWRWRPEVPTGAAPFTGHRRSGYVGLAGALIVVSVAEGFAVHLLLAPWSRLAAGMLTALTAYGILWILGDLRALQLRPTLVTDDSLQIRTGLRWSACIPWNSIERVEAPPRASIPTPPLVRTTPIGPPALVIVLNRMVELKGPFGITRRGDRIGLAADDPRGLRAAIEARITE